MDNMIKMMEKYTDHLEEIVAERTEELVAEKAKTDELLYRMLPRYRSTLFVHAFIASKPRGPYTPHSIVRNSKTLSRFLAAILDGRQEIEGEFTKRRTFLCNSSSRLTTTRDLIKDFRDFSKLVDLGILGC